MDVGAELMQLQDQAHGLRAEIEELRGLHEAALATVDSSRSQSSLLESQLADALARLTTAEGEVMRLAQVEAHLALTKAEVAQVYASQTWKAGRVIIAPMAWMRRLARRRH